VTLNSTIRRRLQSPFCILSAQRRKFGGLQPIPERLSSGQGRLSGRENGQKSQENMGLQNRIVLSNDPLRTCLQKKVGLMLRLARTGRNPCPAEAYPRPGQPLLREAGGNCIF